MAGGIWSILLQQVSYKQCCLLYREPETTSCK